MRNNEIMSNNLMRAVENCARKWVPKLHNY